VRSLFSRFRTRSLSSSTQSFNFALPSRPPYLNRRQQQRRHLRLIALHSKPVNLQSCRPINLELFNDLSAQAFCCRPGELLSFTASCPGFAEQFACQFDQPDVGCIFSDWLPESRTVWEWLSAGNSRDRQHVLTCCRLVGLDHWLNDLPMGPMTLQLSPQLSFTPHERELLLLAVALLQRPPILIWQDCSLIDKASAEQLLHEFHKLNITVIRILEPAPAHWLPWLDE